MKLHRLDCPNGCGHYFESPDPKAVAGHPCPKANGKWVALKKAVK